MRPEFIARVDEIVVFSPLSLESLSKIAALLLDELVEAMKDKNINLKYDEKVCKFIASQCEKTKSGARELRNIIRRNIEDKIVDMIIDGGVSDISLTADESGIIIS